MKLGQFFKKLADSLDGGGPFNPKPEVKAKLESLGYVFHRHVIHMPQAGAAVGHSIDSPDGKPIGKHVFKTDEPTRKYYEDYRRAVEEAAKAAPAP